MYVENIVIGKPVANVSQMFALDMNDWEKKGSMNMILFFFQTMSAMQK